MAHHVRNDRFQVFKLKFKKGSVRKSLYFSISDGLFTAMMQGVSESYLIAYGIALGATRSQIAFLATAPALLASFLQLKSARLTQTIGSRTKLINFTVFFHALSWLPIILIPYLFLKPSALPWALLVAVILFMSFGAFAVPAWQSLMSDYIPVKKRGKYFGWRNRLQGMFTVIISVSAGLILHYFGKSDIRGFTVIFVFAMICRFLAWVCLTQMAEPFRHTAHDAYFSFIDFISQIRTSNFVKFVIFVSIMSLSVNISAPLLAVFLLKDLGLSYAEFMGVVTIASIACFLFQTSFGRAADRLGNLRVLKIAGWGIAIIPMLWMISRNLFFIFFIQFLAGAVWGGFNLLVANFMMEAVSPQKRIRCISYFNVVNSISIFLGAILGGFAIQKLPPLFGYSYLSLFLLSCVCRVLVMFFVSGKIKEVRQF